MIQDIIGAFRANLLTADEAKSYTQRTIESSIQESEARAQQLSASAAEIISSLEECDCDSDDGCCGACDDGCGVETPVSQLIEEGAEVDAEIKAMTAEFEALLKEIIKEK